MTPLIKSLLLYLMMLGLVAFGVVALSIFNFYIYFVYIIIIFVVFYLNRGIVWGKKPLHGLLLGTVLIGIVFALEIIGGWVRIEGFNYKPDILFSFLILQVLIAAGEELSFRGYILKNLIDSSGTKKGILLSSVMFSAIHIPSIVFYKLDVSSGLIALAVVGLLGVILALLYLEYGLLSAMGFHFSWNFLQYNIFTLSRNEPGLMVSRILESNSFTGGNYGPEAGLLGLAIVSLTLVIFIKKHSHLLDQSEFHQKA